MIIKNINNFVSGINYYPALIEGDKKLTYPELKNKIAAAAAALHQKGIKPDDHISLISSNNIDYIIILLALWQLRAIPIPINIRLTKNEIENLISFSKSSFVLVHEELYNNFNFKNIDAVQFPIQIENTSKSFSFPDNGRIDSQNENINEDDAAVIIFTSGSEGKPKGVILSFKNLFESAWTGNSILEQNENDRWLASLPFYHIGGFSIIIRALLFSASIIISKSLKADDLIFSINNYKPTLASLVSTQLQRLIEKGIKPNPELRNVLLGGGFIEKDLIEKALKKKWNIIKVYGSTETSSFITALKLSKEVSKINSAGKPVKPNEIFIKDERNNKLPFYERGEIVIKSSAIMKEYFNNENETSKKIKDGLYYSGDIGYLDEEGYLYIESRRTDLIVSGGENINPIEVENKLIEHPNIAEACVFGFPDTEWGHIAAAAIVINNKKGLTLEELRDFLKDKIAGYKIPRKIFFTDKLPKNELGKIERNKLKEMF